MTENHERIKAYLQPFFQGHGLKPDEDLFSLGFISSMFLIQLVTFVEQEFRFTIDNVDLERENFASIDAIVALVVRSQSRVNP